MTCAALRKALIHPQGALQNPLHDLRRPSVPPKENEQGFDGQATAEFENPRTENRIIIPFQHER
jgi:hypothetical protein